MIYFCYTAFWKFYILLSLVANIVRLFWNDRYKRDISKRRRILVSWKCDIIQSLRPSVKNTALFSQKGSLAQGSLFVLKKYFSTRRRLLKKPRSQVSRTRRRTEVRQSAARAGSQSAVLSIALNRYQSKTERKTSSHRKTLLWKIPYFDGSGSFSTVWRERTTCSLPCFV